MPCVQAYKPTGDGMWVGMAIYVYVYIHEFVCNSLWVSCMVCGCVYT